MENHGATPAGQKEATISVQEALESGCLNGLPRAAELVDMAKLTEDKTKSLGFAQTDGSIQNFG